MGTPDLDATGLNGAQQADEGIWQVRNLAGKAPGRSVLASLLRLIRPAFIVAHQTRASNPAGISPAGL